MLGIINLVLIYILSGFSLFGKHLFHPKKKEDVAEIRGMVVFHTYCVLCHGEKGDGTGRLATGKIPPPANLTKTILNDEQMKAIIRGGGSSVGRSEFMPPWGDELSEGQINDLIKFINVLKAK